VDINALQKSLDEGREKLSELNLAIDQAEDEETMNAAEKAFNEKRDEVESLTEQLEKAMDDHDADQRAKAASARAASMQEVDSKAALGGGQPKVKAEAFDMSAKMKAHEEAAARFLKSGPSHVSGRELDLIKPAKHWSEATEGGITMPRSWGLKMFGLKWARSVGYSDAEIAACVKATMVSSDPGLGGNTVPEDFRPTLLNLPTEEAHILPNATVVPAPTGEVTFPKAVQDAGDEYGGMAGSWISEGGTKPNTDTSFEQVKIPTHEFALHTQISHRLLSRSAIAIENWIQTVGSRVCLDAMDTAFISGTGVGQPLGILNTAGIGTTTRAGAGITEDDLINLKYDLAPYHRGGGTYLMNDDVLQGLELRKDGEGRPLFTASTANGVFDRLSGFPFVSHTRQPALGADGDVIFVDLREYYVAMEQDIVMVRSDHFAFTNNVATIAIFMVVGGRLVQPRVATQLVT